jgi:hypothetical protein
MGIENWPALLWSLGYGVGFFLTLILINRYAPVDKPGRLRPEEMCIAAIWPIMVALFSAGFFIHVLGILGGRLDNFFEKGFRAFEKWFTARY